MSTEPVRTRLPIVALAALLGLLAIIFGALAVPPAGGEPPPTATLPAILSQ